MIDEFSGENVWSKLLIEERIDYNNLRIIRAFELELTSFDSVRILCQCIEVWIVALSPLSFCLGSIYATNAIPERKNTRGN